MKHIKIFPKDWLQLHPYRHSTPVDSYYAGIANQIYDIMEKTELINSFSQDDAKQISIRLAAYFEDVISELGIWRAFITTHKELFGKYLPFYIPDDHYYDDEVNLEDVRFLLWHFTQQYHGFRKGTFVSPDNPTNKSTAGLIYDLFCEEWTTAPENNRMKRLFDPETRYSTQEEYEQLLYWFHYKCYLFTDNTAKLTEYTRSVWDQARSQEHLNELIANGHQWLAYTYKTAMLALTSPQWLARILPESHPDHAFAREAADKSLPVPSEEGLQRARTEYEKFKQAAGDRIMLFFQTAEEAWDFLADEACVIDREQYAWPDEWHGKQVAVYATPWEGTQIIFAGLSCIKDEGNPFYDAEQAVRQAIAFFMVKHCSTNLLEEMMERGMLSDAQAKSIESEERSKAIVQDNWRFLVRYFIREYPQK